MKEVNMGSKKNAPNSDLKSVFESLVEIRCGDRCVPGGWRVPAYVCVQCI